MLKFKVKGGVILGLVRLKLNNVNYKNRVLVIILICLVLILVVLVFNPIWNIRQVLSNKKSMSMNRAPAYESLKTIKLTGEKKYSIPLNYGYVTVHDNNSMIIKADKSTRVKSVDDGIISDIGFNSTYGNYIEISHCRYKKDQIYSFYGFLEDRINGDIIVIQSGQKLGEVGDKGYIYFEIRDKNHKTLSPYDYMYLE